ncbi:Serine/threonine-protein_phosphatase [Hexamita inflata]|uniref:Serine/threonine-protein phosphatase n=1 Tax=Hexamita inflata TaxID=28002 RepID=A0AA86NPB9_9EUKA|nr:Serine/threonine-protein phosphatase [Hexamita inflata]
MFDPHQLLELTLKKQKLSENQLKELVFRVQTLFVMEPNVVSVPLPVQICGDLHGQFYDVVNLFKVGGTPEQCKYIFMGDYVDRGYYSLEVITLLYLYKIIYPYQLYLLRGNHESRAITQIYGFYDQCLKYYQHSSIWKGFIESFDYMPIAAIAGEQVYCVHGGLSPQCPLLDDVRIIGRAIEVPIRGALADCLWSDPTTKNMVEYFKPSDRGAGYEYGPKAVEEFSRSNGIQLIARSHQLAPEGYQFHFNQTCVTVWSCPNYMYKCKNYASIMQVDNHHNCNFLLFTAVDLHEKKPD